MNLNSSSPNPTLGDFRDIAREAAENVSDFHADAEAGRRGEDVGNPENRVLLKSVSGSGMDICRNWAASDRNPNGLTAKEDASGLHETTMATKLADLVTSPQLRMIRSIARGKALDAENECEMLFGCGVGELSRNAASVLIGRLTEILPYVSAVRKAG